MEKVMEDTQIEPFQRTSGINCAREPVNEYRQTQHNIVPQTNTAKGAMSMFFTPSAATE